MELMLQNCCYSIKNVICLQGTDFDKKIECCFLSSSSFSKLNTDIYANHARVYWVQQHNPKAKKTFERCIRCLPFSKQTIFLQNVIFVTSNATAVLPWHSAAHSRVLEASECVFYWSRCGGWCQVPLSPVPVSDRSQQSMLDAETGNR